MNRSAEYAVFKLEYYTQCHEKMTPSVSLSFKKRKVLKQKQLMVHPLLNSNTCLSPVRWINTAKKQCSGAAALFKELVRIFDSSERIFGSFLAGKQTSKQNGSALTSNRVCFQKAKRKRDLGSLSCSRPGLKCPLLATIRTAHIHRRSWNSNTQKINTR